jgi:alpha-beta hydrolase superfamily lysophospholipase
MTPVVFEGCFGWLHPAAGKRGIVMCAPHGYEELCVHRQWAGLADRFAAAGLPTLRFDYRGTGDSIGDDEEPQRLHDWIESVKDAVRFLRQQADVSEVALVGLRLGGTLATLAASDLGDIDMLALLVPCVTGRAYSREMKALAAFSPRPADAGEQAPTGDDIEAGGFVLTAETVAALKDVDLRQLERRPARRVLLMEDADVPADSRLARRLQQLGADVQTAPFNDFERFICEVHYGQRTPEAAFSTLTNWLQQQAPDSVAAWKPRATARLEMPDAIETPVFFGDGARLFGIICEPPPDKADRYVPPVLFINTGHHHHINVSRLAVTLGRRLAAQGITSMRIDIAGLGDSPAWPGGTENALYNKSSCADVRAAIDCLEAHGHRHCVLFGLCSGAYLSFHTAVQDARVTSQVMINLQKFIWRDGDSLEVTTRTNAMLARDLGIDLFRVARNVEKWRGLMRGGRKEWLALWAVLRRAVELQISALGRLAHLLFGVEGQVARGFRLLSQLGTDSLLVYSADDGGLVELEVHNLRRAGSSLRGHQRVRVELIDGADHTLTLRPARERLARIVETHLGARPPVEATAELKEVRAA